MLSSHLILVVMFISASLIVPQYLSAPDPVPTPSRKSRSRNTPSPMPSQATHVHSPSAISRSHTQCAAWEILTKAGTSVNAGGGKIADMDMDKMYWPQLKQPR